MFLRIPRLVWALLLLLLPAALGPSRQAVACSLCPAGQITLTEDLVANDAAVIVKLVAAALDPAAGPSVFEVVEALQGEHHLSRDPQAVKPYRISLLYFGDAKPGTRFLVFGQFRPNGEWGTPLELSDAAADYVRKLPALVNADTDRLMFCQTYFEHPDPVLANDAYDEFARAPFSSFVAIRERMPREQLLRWIADKNITTQHRKLYLSMLGAFGRPEDAAMIEKLIRADDRATRLSLDAMLGAYLALRKAEGLPLIEDLFLKNARAEYTDTYAAIMAVRFIGTEAKTIPRERLAESLRHVLGRPKLADLVISDLTRWEDWSAMPRLVELFKKAADEETTWVRIPVVNYLRACPQPEAKTHLEELAKIDPEAFKRAKSLVPEGLLPSDGSQRKASE
jgi:hypothetical protein